MLCKANEVLENHFCYDSEDIGKFSDAFGKNIREEETNLLFQVDSEFKNIMRNNKEARKSFTAKFCSFYIAKTLYDDMDFDYNEVDFFYKIFYKYIS